MVKTITLEDNNNCYQKMTFKNFHVMIYENDNCYQKEFK